MVDDLDRRILGILRRDGQTPFRDIAAQAGTTVGTVHNRIKKMQAEGVIQRFAPVLDAALLGFPVTAMVEVRIDGGHLEGVQRALAEDPHVTAIYDVTGEVDTVVVAKFRDTRDLDGFVKRAARMAHVKETRTRLVLNIVKEGTVPRFEAA